MIHHVSLEVSDLERSGALLRLAARLPGWRRQIDNDSVIGWGIVQAGVLRRSPARRRRAAATSASRPTASPRSRPPGRGRSRHGGDDEGAPGRAPSTVGTTTRLTSRPRRLPRRGRGRRHRLRTSRNDYRRSRNGPMATVKVGHQRLRADRAQPVSAPPTRRARSSSSSRSTTSPTRRRSPTCSSTTRSSAASRARSRRGDGRSASTAREIKVLTERDPPPFPGATSGSRS